MTVRQTGFTAVELLVTLFIASIFLFAGYQLYTQVTREGAYADKAARISNIVYEKLRKTTGGMSDQTSCTANTPTNEPITVTGFPSVVLSVAITCPYGTSKPISLVTVTATYDDNITSNNTLVHGVYVR